MDITVSNFGTVAEAQVHIGGLTVITGENDTGKSTIGKILFSIVKAISRFEEDLEEDKEVRITSLAESLYFSIIRRNINITSQTDIRDLFHPKKLYIALKLDYISALNERYKILNVLLESNSISEKAFAAASIELEKIRSILEEPDDKYTAMSRAIGKAFFSEFRGEITQKGPLTTKNASVKVTDGVNPLISIDWSSDAKSKFEYKDELGFNDATYVESPSIIQFHNLVQMSKTLFESKDGHIGRGTVPLHLKDLANKLSDSMYRFLDFDLIHDGRDDSRMKVSAKINQAFQGEISYDSEKFDFLLSRDGYTVSSGNIASGVKALGILDMLIKGGNADVNTLLILDEPEVNLHPKWQVLYSELVCELVRAGVDIIITTHSPYVLDALKYYSDACRIENRFYLAEKFPGEEYSNFIDVSDNISHAIDLLAEPLHNLHQDSLDDF